MEPRSYDLKGSVSRPDMRDVQLTSTSVALNLLDAHRPQPGRPAGAGDRTRLQDGPPAIRVDSTGVDAQIRNLNTRTFSFAPSVRSDPKPGVP